MGEQTDKAAARAAGSLLPSASADGLKGLEAKPLPLWTSVPFHIFYLKGLKPTKEPAKPEQSSIRLLKQTAKENLRHKTCLRAVNPKTLLL